MRKKEPGGHQRGDERLVIFKALVGITTMSGQFTVIKLLHLIYFIFKSIPLYFVVNPFQNKLIKSST